jgi:DUF1680 family protein
MLFLPTASDSSPPFPAGRLAGAAPRWPGLALLAAGLVVFGDGLHAAEFTELPLKSPPHASFRFEGIVGDRVKANIDHWLLTAPLANPGMLEMFRLRDRQPTPNLVPWAGEFVGKYLISAIQTLRMTERPELRTLVSQTVADLIACQAEDGYLGPFPKPVRLKANWDLWGHYHCMLALLMWYEATGDHNALVCCRRAADLICHTFLDSKLRVFDVGSNEMNMAVIHVLGRLYRLTHEPRYLQMVRAIEQDWSRAGDYLQTALSGREFFETPRPRWESLPDLQGLLELYRITGDTAYRTAFTHHWRSIARWDRRNTGAFSSGEQATGNPYAPTAIETCCTVAWMALTLDMLKLSADSRVADELELSFYNAALGALHPSGRWCTYNTPMDGIREASAQTIVFQARAGTPELNCCAVNGPRGLGLLSEWAVLLGNDVLAVNSYGRGSFQGNLADNTPVALNWVTDYPFSEKVQLRVEPLVARRFSLWLRIPAWSRHTAVALNSQPCPNVQPGRYLELVRRWEPGDRIDLEFDFALRALPGDREALGRVSVYRGPLLLAYDQALNDFDDAALPPVDLSRLGESRLIRVRSSTDHDRLAPYLTMALPAAGGRWITVCDFASAGAQGTRYRSWLPAVHPLPPAVVTQLPRDGAVLDGNPTRFHWTGPARPDANLSEYQLFISPTEDFQSSLLVKSGIQTNEVVLDAQALKPLTRGETYYWKILAENHDGTTESVRPPASFKLANPPLSP